MPHSTAIKVDKKSVKKKERKTNFVDSEQIMSRSKVSKKSKSSRKDDGASPTRHAKEDDEMLPIKEIDLQI